MKKLNPISCLAFFIVLYVARNAISYAVYPLMVLLAAFTAFQFVNIKNATQTLTKTIKIFFPIILLIIIEVIALFATAFPFHGRSLDIIKDVVFISVFLFLLSCLISSKDEFMQWVKKMSKYFVLFAIIIALFGLWKFLYSPDFISYRTTDGVRSFKWGTSLVTDYNFFSLFLLNGVIFGLYIILQFPEKIKHKALFLTALQFIVFIGLLTGSRRYIFCIAFFFVVCLLSLIPWLFKKLFSQKISYKYLLLFLTFFVLNFGVSYSFLSYFPLVTEKAEKTLFIDADKTDLNIAIVANRINSAARFHLIKPHFGKKQVSDVTNSELASINASRKDLWDLGEKIFNEYSMPHKIFGNGFHFFNTFKQETQRFFYPHHLFRSVLLFFGIFGLTLYIAILLWSFILYVFHIKNLGVLCLLFVINFSFAFFSFTDFFGSSFYSILIIVPIFYRHLYRYEKNNPLQISS